MLSYIQDQYRKYTFIRFLIVGFLNTVFGYVVFSFFSLLGAHYTLAVLFAFVAGMLFNFYTYGNLVFYKSDSKLIVKFFMVYLFLYCLDTISLSFMLSHGINVYLAQCVITLPLVLCTYLLTKDFVFRA